MDDQEGASANAPVTNGNHPEAPPNSATPTRANRALRDQAHKDVANYRWGRKRPASNLLTLKGLGYRSPAYRRTRRLMREIESALGGAENLTPMEREMVQHGAVLGAIAQDIETKYLMGQRPDLLILCRVLKAQRSCFDAIGYRRRARDVTPSLDSFLGNLEESK
jgi:hypothetical protein